MKKHWFWSIKEARGEEEEEEEEKERTMPLE